MDRNKGMGKIAIIGIVLLILLIAGGGLFLVNRISRFTPPSIVSKEAVTINPVAPEESAVNADIISQISGISIKPGSIKTDLLGKMIKSFNFNVSNNTWYDFSSDQNVQAKTVSFSFLPIENAAALQPIQKAETITGPDGDIRIISSTYNKDKSELDFQIYYKKSFLDALTPDETSIEWTSSIFRTLSLSSNPDSFKKDSGSFAKMLSDIVGQQKLLEVTK